MDILQVPPRYYPSIGGVEKHVHHLSHKLSEYGCNITVFTSNVPGTKSFEIADGIRIRRFNTIGNPLRNPINPTMLIALMKKVGQFDIVHAHSEYHFSTLLCSITKVTQKFPFVITNHGQLSFGDCRKDALVKMYRKIAIRRVYNKADAIIALSPSDRKYLLSLGINSEKVSVIPNAIDPSKVKHFHYEEHTTLAHKLKLDGKRIVLFVGPIVERKGVSTLIHAIPQIVQDNHDTLFVLTGEGSFKRKANSLARSLKVEEHVHFTGFLPEKELYNMYELSDVFVLPSLSEGVPTTILEALAFSKPVISTRIPGVKDYFSDVCYLVSPKDVDELAFAINRLLEDEKLARHLGEAGRRLVEREFTWDAVAKSIFELYEKVLATQV